MNALRLWNSRGAGLGNALDGAGSVLDARFALNLLIELLALLKDLVLIANFTLLVCLLLPEKACIGGLLLGGDGGLRWLDLWGWLVLNSSLRLLQPSASGTTLCKGKSRLRRRSGCQGVCGRHCICGLSLQVRERQECPKERDVK